MDLMFASKSAVQLMDAAKHGLPLGGGHHITNGTAGAWHSIGARRILDGSGPFKEDSWDLQILSSQQFSVADNVQN